MPVIDLEREARRLADTIAAEEFGSLSIETITPIVRPDSSGETSIFLGVQLRDPEVGQETWPIDDVLALKRAAREHATGLGVVVYVQLAPESDPPQDDEGE